MISTATYNLELYKTVDLSHFYEFQPKMDESISVLIGQYTTKVSGANKISQLFQSNTTYKTAQINNFLNKHEIKIDKHKKIIDKHGLEILNARKKLNESFDKSSKRINNAEIFKDYFQKMAREIQFLHFEDCFVDLSQKRKRIDFNLALGNDILVSIAKNIEDQTNKDVMFAISHKKENIIIDQMELQDLLKKIKEMLNIIKEQH